MSKLKSRKQFCDDNAIRFTTFHKEVNTGRLKILKIGRKTVVSEEDEARWRETIARGGAVGLDRSGAV
ncbi:MAG TPA: hypothetical protein VHL31_20615 [Geminicoccus sp.]|jgi:hypothetical protein|uniref:hypothetical protein n=1 Tax=Geminicoccus sp. TaxID=2024832 RepID=UPI002E37ECC0|nr:hypothetical protein [Geminicoccus sp.]HEX2528684.1 hypothetical protein [Geminicoccus sp.]